MAQDRSSQISARFVTSSAKGFPPGRGTTLAILNENDKTKRDDCFWLQLSQESYRVSGNEERDSASIGFADMEFGRFWWHSEGPWDQAAHFIVACEPEFAPLVEGHFYGRAVPIHLDFTFARTLLDDCQSNHHWAMPPPEANRQLPTRLLHIRNPASTGHVSIRLTERVAGSPYVVLSHRWSDYVDCVTLLRNLKKYETEIEFSILPQTFQDAVTVTTGLGFSHLWTDRLCIVQDDQHEWETECSKMADIYSNAARTIAAVSAAGSAAGFLGARGGFGSEYTCQLTYWKKPSLPEASVTIEYIGNDCDRLRPGFHNLLDQRGRTLQEKMLSPCLLSFDVDKMFWECYETRRLESLHFVRYDDCRSWRTVKINPKKIGRAEIYTWWYDLVDDYCQRKLTYQMDKLPAVSGIAALVHRLTGDTYLAGIWQGDLSSGLAWSNHLNSGFADKALQDLQLPYRAPSWSWARSDCGSAVPSCGINDRFNETIHGYVDFVAAHMVSSRQDQYGKVEQGGWLRIRAQAKQGFIGSSLQPLSGLFTENDQVVLEVTSSTTQLVQIRVNIDDPKLYEEILAGSVSLTRAWHEDRELLEVTTVRLCNCEVPSRKAMISYGLVLVRTKHWDSFTRIGLRGTGLLKGFGGTPTSVDTWFADTEIQELNIF